MQRRARERKLSMARQIKISAKFGNIISRKAKLAKFNKKYKGKMMRHHHIGWIINRCDLRQELLHNYGNIMKFF